MPHPLFEIGFIDLPKSGGGGDLPPAPLVPTVCLKGKLQPFGATEVCFPIEGLSTEHLFIPFSHATFHVTCLHSSTWPNSI